MLPSKSIAIVLALAPWHKIDWQIQKKYLRCLYLLNWTSMKIFLCSLTSWDKYCFLHVQVSHKRKIDCQIDHQGSYLLNQIWADLTESMQLFNQHWASELLSFTIITSYSTYKFNTKLKSSTRSSASYQVSISNNSVFRVGVTLKTKTIKFYTTKLVTAVLHLHEEHRKVTIYI